MKNYIQVLSAFDEELRKIGEVNLSGLSPTTVLSQKPPEPFVTPGLDKAQQILSRAIMDKQASRLEDKHEKQVRAVRQAGSHTLAGAGIGRLLAGLSFKKDFGPSPRQKTMGTLVGATAGLTDHLLEKRYLKRKAERRKSQLKKHADTSPPELHQLELDKKIDTLAKKDPSVDADKLRSKAKAMHRGGVIGGAITPVIGGAAILHPSLRKMVTEDWKNSPVRTVLTYGPAAASIASLTGKAGASVAGKLHDLKHGSPVEKTSSVPAPKAQLLKGQSAFRFSTQKPFRPPGVG